MLFIDQKYLNLVAAKLDKFVQKKTTLWNCRCSICGDSKKNKIKARGYFYVKKNNIFYRCHNCGASLSLGSFLKMLDPALFSEYRMEYYKEGKHSNVPKPDFKVQPQKAPVAVKVDLGLASIDSLPEHHMARMYVSERKIPKDKWKSLFYTPDYKAFINEVLPGCKDDIKKWKDGDVRLVIPYFDKNKNLLGVQGRTLLNSKVRYITVKSSDDAKKIFGLDRVDTSRKIYVVEGPLDSLFLDNAVATMDSSLVSVIEAMGEHDYIYVYDNEPRNKDVVKQMRKTIAEGHSVCIWPSDMEQKDINEMVLSGLNPSEIQHIIDAHTYSGVRAKLEFERWKKVVT